MSAPLLKLAEAYYLVAEHLEQSGRPLLEMADSLNRIADRLCEQNVSEEAAKEREKQP